VDRLLGTYAAKHRAINRLGDAITRASQVAFRQRSRRPFSTPKLS